MESLKRKISKIYYNHGLFCATHPIQIITCVCLIVIFLCFPLTQLPVIKDVPLDHVVLREDEFLAFENSHLFNSGNPNKSLGYCIQIILHSTFAPATNNGCSRPDQLLVNLLQQSAELVRSLREFRSTTTLASSRVQSFEDACFQVEDRVVTELETTDTIFNMLPTFDCLLLAPSLLWRHQDVEKTLTPGEHLFARLKQAAVGDLRNLFFGMPWKLTGVTRKPVCNEPSTMAFAVTLVLREYDPDFIEKLRDHVVTQFVHNRNSTVTRAQQGSTDDPDTNHSTLRPNVHDSDGPSTPNVRNIYLVWYRGRSYLSDYAPLILIYLVLLLYIYFSVCKLEMVKSKIALAFSACFTVVASLCMSLGLCITIGLMVPTLSGSEIFPYLVVLIGFENVIVLTKSVVATPVDLPVKYRIAQGLSKESWPLTKQYFTQLVLLCLGFLTFHPTMQEFCLFAMVGVTTDFFLQLFFFVTVLSVDIRRMELSDLSSQYQSVAMLCESKHLLTNPPISTESQDLSSSAPPLPETANNAAQAVFRFRGMNHGIVLPFVRYCIRRAFALCIIIGSWTRFYFAKVFSKVRPRLRPGHKRRVSAAEAAAFLASDDKPTANVPRRLWLLRSWAKHRLVQRIFMFAVAIWLVIFVLYTVDLAQLVDTFHPSPSTSSSVTADDNLGVPTPEQTDRRVSIDEPEPKLPALDSDSTEEPPSTSSKSSLWDVELGGKFGDLVRAPPWLHPSEATWDHNLLWNYLAFYQWPYLAKHYNLSLSGCHLAILEPIHLKHEIPSSSGAESLQGGAASEALSKYFPYGVPERSFDWNWVSYTALQEFLIQSFNANRKDNAPSGDSPSDTERSQFLGLPEELLKIVDKLNPRPLSTHVSPGGIAGWTARLWLTASLLKTSFLGCSLVLLVTCLGMICFQELQSKSSTPSQREPVIRVLPLTIPLTDSSEMGSKEEFENEVVLFTPDWILACGKHQTSTPQGSVQVAGIVAACGLPKALHLGPPATSVIRLWCTTSGVALPPIYRYSSSAVFARQNAVVHSKLPTQRRSTVWTMRFLCGGSLLAGCSDGTVERWDCKSAQLSTLFYPTLEAEDTSCPKTNSSSSQPRSKHPGGVTVLRVTDEQSFAIGTSRGHVAWFDLCSDQSSTHLPTARFPTRHWHIHSRPVMGLKCTIISNHAGESQTHIRHWILISGSEDGRVCFYSTSTGECLYQVSLDSAAILSFDFSKLMLAVSYASGNLYAVSFGLYAQSPTDSASFSLSLDMIGDPIHLARNRKHSTTNHTRSTPHAHSGSVGLHWYSMSNALRLIDSDGLQRPCAKAFRLVTCELDSTVAIWNLDPPSLLRTFRLNLSTIRPGDPLLTFENRVIFGDQGYLRVINPWTAKYERSIQLLPPSTVLLQNSTTSFSSSILAAILRRWSKELVPLGIAGPSCSVAPDAIHSFLKEKSEGQPVHSSAGSVLVSVADEGRTLVIIPLATLKAK
ncbi:Sterol regulatory element-binding protein cleavage-activating protein [Clonorchis sinensis]|uniref:Sterol regulatory element-binding protein cleavage-activating protein n=1 Tax=Clonorchis sinensis TaxID=79923 RepID=A0A8T1M7S9_CLOSI|nr:Sterol regulatory element-binding protein cleavage-activating protein [Clonorchis sinensis]